MAFASLKDFPPSPGSGKKNMKQFIRRRRWSRTRIHSVKIRDVLMGKNLDHFVDGKDGSSLKQKIETLLGWRKANKKYETSNNMSVPSPLSTSADVGKTSKSAPILGRRSFEIIDDDVVLEEVFEQEQRFGTHQEWTDPINSNNLKRWSCRDGSVSSATFSDVAPQLPSGFKWVGHWNIDNSTKYSDKVDDDGWSYANTFWPVLISGNDTDFPTGSKTNTVKDKARRRRWIRHRRRMAENEEAVASLPEMADMPQEPKAPHFHSSKQLDALDLPPSPSETEQRTHKRNASEQLLEVLDLSAPITQRGDGQDEEDFFDNEPETPTFSSQNTRNLFREGSGPLSEGLQRLPLSPDRKDLRHSQDLCDAPNAEEVANLGEPTCLSVPRTPEGEAILTDRTPLSEEAGTNERKSAKDELEEFYEIDPQQQETEEVAFEEKVEEEEKEKDQNEDPKE